MATSVMTNPIIGGGGYKLKNVTKETLTKNVSKQFVPSADGNFIIVAGNVGTTRIVTLDGVTFEIYSYGSAVASGQYVEYNGDFYISAKSFIEVTVQDNTNDNVRAYIYEYEPID